MFADFISIVGGLQISCTISLQSRRQVVSRGSCPSLISKSSNIRYRVNAKLPRHKTSHVFGRKKEINMEMNTLYTEHYESTFQKSSLTSA